MQVLRLKDVASPERGNIDLDVNIDHVVKVVYHKDKRGTLTGSSVHLSDNSIERFDGAAAAEAFRDFFNKFQVKL